MELFTSISVELRAAASNNPIEGLKPRWVKPSTESLSPNLIKLVKLGLH